MGIFEIRRKLLYTAAAVNHNNGITTVDQARINEAKFYKVQPPEIIHKCLYLYLRTHLTTNTVSVHVYTGKHN